MSNRIRRFPKNETERTDVTPRLRELKGKEGGGGERRVDECKKREKSRIENFLETSRSTWASCSMRFVAIALLHAVTRDSRFVVRTTTTSLYISRFQGPKKKKQ